MKTIAIIMTVHNRCQQTINCLRKLYNSNSKFDVYITDDGSTDGTSEYIKKEFPYVHIIKGDGNLFWNRGMYEAFKTAVTNNYDYYLWLNDDTDLLPSSISTLLECSYSENDKSIICGATVSFENNKIVTYGGYSKEIKMLPLSNQKQYCHFASGNILLIPAYVYNKVGLLDYKFRHALGDFDYEGRARKKGIKIVQAPGYLGFCERHKDLPKWRNKNIPIKTRIKELYKPLGRNPFEFFIYDNRHNGIIIAFIHFFTLHIRCLMPQLWGKRYNEKE